MNKLLHWFIPNQETWLHRCNPSLKFVMLFIIMVFVFFSRMMELYVGFIICLSLLLWSSSGFPWRKLMLLHIPILMSALSSALSLMLFGRGNDVLWYWWIVKVSHQSIDAGIMIGIKSILIGIIGLILLLTSPPVKLLYSFMQQLSLPAKYAYAFIAGLRLIPFIIEEFELRKKALKVRRVRRHRGITGIYSTIKLYLIPLIAQAIRRAHRIGIAMAAKQFQQQRTYYYELHYSRYDLLFMSFTLISSCFSLYLAVR